MALRSIAMMREILDDVAAACPGVRIFNYTNPIVAQAVADHTAVPIASLCEGPIFYPEEVAKAAGLDPGRAAVRGDGGRPPRAAAGAVGARVRQRVGPRDRG